MMFCVTTKYVSFMPIHNRPKLNIMQNYANNF